MRLFLDPLEMWRACDTRFVHWLLHWNISGGKEDTVKEVKQNKKKKNIFLFSFILKEKRKEGEKRGEGEGGVVEEEE